MFGLVNQLASKIIVLLAEGAKSIALCKYSDVFTVKNNSVLYQQWINLETRPKLPISPSAAYLKNISLCVCVRNPIKNHCIYLQFLVSTLDLLGVIKTLTFSFISLSLAPSEQK